MAKQTASILNDLVEVSKNGELGFRAAADDAQNPELKALLSRRAQDCAAGAAELQQIVLRLGETPEDSGTIAGAMHRGWTNLKAAVTGRTDLAILEEVERGEDVAKAAYSDALKEPLPADIMAVVRRQYDGVVRNHDQIRDLRNRLRETA